MAVGTESILTVENLKLSFTRYTKRLEKRQLNVINDLDIDVKEGEIVSIVGSSGSGKSLLAHAILGILPDNAVCEGTIKYRGEELTQERKEQLRGREICLIPQSVHYIDPLMKVSKFVQLSVADKREAASRQRKIFDSYGLEQQVDDLYPFQLSGGMIRRVLVSTAAIVDARLIIADEPTPGLDEKTLDETLSVFQELRDRGCSILLITHDIEAALKISDRVAIFYAGSTLEIANKTDFSGDGENLRHPYSKALWKALPANGFHSITGSQPSPLSLPRGCLFRDRCHHCDDHCRSIRPELSEARDGKARCVRAEYVHEHAHLHEGESVPHVHAHIHVEEGELVPHVHEYIYVEEEEADGAYAFEAHENHEAREVPVAHEAPGVHEAREVPVAHEAHGAHEAPGAHAGGSVSPVAPGDGGGAHEAHGN